MENLAGLSDVSDWLHDSYFFDGAVSIRICRMALSREILSSRNVIRRYSYSFNFWHTKLIQFNGNFTNAEMVKTFILSGEYRHRFGP